MIRVPLLLTSAALAAGLSVLSTSCQSTHVSTPATRSDSGSATSSDLPSIASRMRGFARRDGFMPLWVKESEAKLFLEAEVGREFIYVPWLSTGLGSNPVGLDRGKAGGEKLVSF